MSRMSSGNVDETMVSAEFAPDRLMGEPSMTDTASNSDDMTTSGYKITNIIRRYAAEGVPSFTRRGPGALTQSDNPPILSGGAFVGYPEARVSAIENEGLKAMIDRLFFLGAVLFSERLRQRSKSLILKRYVSLCAGLLCVAGAQAQNINYVDASFSVEYNNQLTQGENHLKIQRDQNRYKLDFVLDHWLLSSSQKAIFEMDQCQVQPLSYIATSKRPLKKEIIQTLDFDWEHKKVEYISEDKKKTFDLNARLYDPISFFFEARCELMAGKKEFVYPLIRKGKKTTHTYHVVGTEMIETGQGQVNALVVERERTSKKRQTRLYVAPELDYLLVKIVHQEGPLVKIVATLKNMEYELVQGE